MSRMTSRVSCSGELYETQSHFQYGVDSLFGARYDPDGHVETIFVDIGVSNGIGFSPDNKIMCKCMSLSCQT
jgi:sugar lactone lactonase YvrE